MHWREQIGKSQMKLTFLKVRLSVVLTINSRDCKAAPDTHQKTFNAERENGGVADLSS